ncbi:hypothetical protein Ga0609869_000496 [Rhodovulum iodosum]|uniref:DUF4153 domain-containing protein n=1 Tax=Rhodovulum iodosum TaxID=68291 RepID=A0ABV3XPA1_9RHOB|nr:DUF4153 domain-containing protein [Rhodovulum robiginosum]RSK31556.1 DUF4153 domain-containing protein [Rhodovulum robiginosum]
MQLESPFWARAGLGLLGFLAGAAAWLLAEVLPEQWADAPRQLLFVGGLGFAFFVPALALSGPLPMVRALLASAGLALPLAGLLTSASERFETVSAYLDTGHPVFIFALLVFLPLPFLIAALGPGTRWSHYPTLFHQSWMIVVRFAAAWLFVGLVWAVLFLSNALFELVGIDIIERLLDREEVPYLLSGLTLGLALAVVNELSGYVSPYLILRLLRLLLPVVLVVVAVFLGALPLRGLSDLFGSLSAAAVLLAMAAGAATLVSTALDARDDRQVRNRVMRWACQALALLLPALAALAGYAVWLRVAQYGLSPDRLGAAALSVLALGYGLAYAGAVLLRRNWAGRIRRANVVMALAGLAAGLAWFTPVFDVQRISVANQIARLEAGAVSAEDIDLWSMGREWGRAGRAGLDRIAAMTDHPEAADLAARLADLDEAETRYAFERRGEVDDAAALAARIAERLPVRPEGAALPEGLLDSLRLWELEQISQSCTRRTPAGNPGCVMLMAELSGARAGTEAVLAAFTGRGGLMLRGYFATEDGAGYAFRAPEILKDGAIYTNPGAVIDAILAGEVTLHPVPLNALSVEGGEVFFGR